MQHYKHLVYTTPPYGLIPVKGFMARDFNKQRRDASNSSFRNSSPNRNRDEQRSPRPRLNRQTVDRAWESGAQQQHADYRPRTGGGQFRTQGQRNSNGRTNNAPNRQDYSSQNGRSGSRPNNSYNRSYNNRDDNFRDNRSSNYQDDRSRRDNRNTSRSFDRPYGANNDYRSTRSSYEQDGRDFGGPRSGNRHNSFEQPNHRGSSDRQHFQNHDNSRRNVADNDRPRWQNRTDEQRNSNRGGSERNFNRRYSDASERFQGDYEQFDERSPRPARSVDKEYEGRTSRPHRANERSFADRDTRKTRSSRDERFEDRDNRDTRPARPTERPFSGTRHAQDKPERRFNEQKNEAQPEKHVTRLPDGRVMKGSRSDQRKKAQFWTGVSSDRDELVNRVHEANIDDELVNRVQESDIPIQEEQVNESPQTLDEGPVELSPAMTGEVSPVSDAQEPAISNEQPDEVVSIETPTQEETSGTTPPKRRTRAASASAVTRAKKPRSTGPKPSQRGFKWPTAE